MKARIDRLIDESLRDGTRARRDLGTRAGGDVARAAQLVVASLRAGGKVLVCGNGGSAADAQHLAAELVGRFVRERRALPALALTVDSSALTAIGNDYGFDRVFARQVEALGSRGDVLIAITTSGGSPNVRAAIAAARERGMTIVGLTGKKGESMRALCDACIAVPSTVTARIQECHLTVVHLLCEAVDEAIDAVDEASDDGYRTGEKLQPLSALVARRARWRAEGRTVVWTNGNFDVMHAGHLASLTAARALGDLLVVGVNCDAQVRAAKGEGRPVFPVEERAAMLAGLEVVDYVVVFDEPTPEAALAALQPDVHCKGADYAPPHGAPIPERAVVEGYGGRIAFLPMVAGRSSSSTIRKLQGAE